MNFLFKEPHVEGFFSEQFSRHYKLSPEEWKRMREEAQLRQQWEQEMRLKIEEKLEKKQDKLKMIEEREKELSNGN